MAGASSLNECDITKDVCIINFANSNSYGLNGQAWPNETYLLSEVVIMTEDEFQEVLIKRFKNNTNTGEHAEVYFLEYLKKVLTEQHHAKTYHMDVEIFLSYSPCDPCAKKITEFLKDNKIIELQIQIGTFYRLNEEQHIIGLKSLISTPYVELKTFTSEEDWKHFLKIADLPEDLTSHIRTDKRKYREVIDRLILGGLKWEVIDQCEDCRVTLCQKHKQLLQ